MRKRHAFAQNLLHWYRRNARDLPWRKTRDPYKIWISEIMLQQTTVAAVVPYFLRWVKRFPTVHHVSRAELQTVLKFWQGLGYYRRAKNIHQAAKIISRDMDGKIPQDSQVLRQLPGFGPYTTGAVLSIAYDRREPIIDANVRRVVMRQEAIKGYAETSKDKTVLRFLDDVMPLKGNNIFNQALMELGALVCRSRNPLCLMCPVKYCCRAYRKGIQELIPQAKHKVIKEINAVIALIEQKGRYYIQKRGPKGLLADLWEFPGGKINAGETVQHALQREMREELGAYVRSARAIARLTHCYTDYRVKLHVWACKLENEPRVDSTHRWVKRQTLQKYPMPSGSAKIVDLISKVPEHS